MFRFSNPSQKVHYWLGASEQRDANIFFWEKTERTTSIDIAWADGFPSKTMSTTCLSLIWQPGGNYLIVSKIAYNFANLIQQRIHNIYNDITTRLRMSQICFIYLYESQQISLAKFAKRCNHQQNFVATYEINWLFLNL